MSYMRNDSLESDADNRSHGSSDNYDEPRHRSQASRHSSSQRSRSHSAQGRSRRRFSRGASMKDVRHSHSRRNSSAGSIGRSKASSRRRGAGLTRATFVKRFQDYLNMNEITEAQAWCKNALKREVTRGDLSDGKKLTWADVQMQEARLKMFYRLQPGDTALISEIYECYTAIIHAIEKVTAKKDLEDWPTHLISMESEIRAMMAYLLAKFTGDIGEALHHSRRALHIDPNSCEANAVHGYILDRCLDNLEDAHTYLEHALKLDDENALVHSWYAMLLANEHEYEIGDGDDSDDEDNESISHELCEDQEFLLFGSHERDDTQRIIVPSIEEHFRISINLAPNWSVMYANYGLHKINREQFQEARVLLNKAVELDEHNLVAANNCAWVCSLPDVAEFDRARDLWENIVHAYPNDATALANLARLYAHAFSDYNRAKKLYWKALMKQDSNPHIHFFFATLWRHAYDDDEKAARFMKKAFDENSEVVSWDADSYLQQGVLLAQKGKYSWAEDVLRRGLAINPDDSRSFNTALQYLEHRITMDAATDLPLSASAPATPMARDGPLSVSTSSLSPTQQIMHGAHGSGNDRSLMEHSASFLFGM